MLKVLTKAGLELQEVSLMLRGQMLIAPFSLAIAPGEIVTLMGASGSGKSSLLSFVGGDLAETITGSGDVLLNGTSVTRLPPEQRGIGRLFQDDLLFPHMSVGENLLFAMRGGSKVARHDAIREALDQAELTGFEDRAPQTLSGGQRSRVALMRALLAKPSALLLDEPFSKLDRELRASIRQSTFSHIVARQIPALLVSHDPDDAPRGGRVLQIGKTGEVRDV